jgi:hypothetical protein
MSALEEAAVSAPRPSPALQRALIRIDREFGAAAIHRTFKDKMRRVLRAGVDHEARARYGTWAQTIADRRLDLAGAAIVTARAYAMERERHRTAALLWGARPPRLDLIIFHEMAVALRFLRRHHPRTMAELLTAFGCAVPIATRSDAALA